MPDTVCTEERIKHFCVGCFGGCLFLCDTQEEAVILNDIVDDPVLSPEREKWFSVHERMTRILLGSVLDYPPAVKENAFKSKAIRDSPGVRLSIEQQNEIKVHITPMVREKEPHQVILDDIEENRLNICKDTGESVSYSKLVKLIGEVKRDLGISYSNAHVVGKKVYEMRCQGWTNGDIAKALNIKPATASTSYRRYRSKLEEDAKLGEVVDV
jgi:hypothetical protein